MTTISDQSTIPTWDLPTWAIVTAVAAGVLFSGWVHARLRDARQDRREQTLRPKFRPCQVTTACPYHATEMVLWLDTEGVQIRDACKGCADRGIARQWWTRIPEEDQ